MKKTENGYILIQIPATEFEKETMLGISAGGYKAIVVIPTDEYKEKEEIFVTKAGLLIIDKRSNTYAIHKDRVVGRF